MSGPLWPGHTLAVLWDADDTIIPGYQQDAIFNEYGVNPGDFWADVSKTVATYEAQYAEQMKQYYAGVAASVRGKTEPPLRHRPLRVDPDTAYLLTFLSWVRDGRFPGLSNEKLRELGKDLKFHQGMPQAMKRLADRIEKDPKYAMLDIKVENYVISQGMRQLLLGSPVAKYATGIYGCEFVDELLPAGFALDKSKSLKPEGQRQISTIAYAFGDTEKTAAIFEISKGTSVDPSIGVNDAIAQKDRRIPLSDMIYVGDGPTDVPAWSLLKKAGGGTLAVYNPDPNAKAHRDRAHGLFEQKRVEKVAAADYRPGSDAMRWLEGQLVERAEAIREKWLADKAKRIRKPGTHINAITKTQDAPRVVTLPVAKTTGRERGVA